MFELKPLSKDAIPAALEKAMRYRLLNEPGAAESICHDILRADPDNQPALITLLLALTDRYEKPYEIGGTKPEEILTKLQSDYDRAYYAGIILERRAKAKLAQGHVGSNDHAYENFRQAMQFYEKAETLRPPGNDDAVLRWNACARVIMINELVGREDDRSEHQLE